MQVTIDGVDYVPEHEIQTDNRLLAALEVRFNSDAGDNITVRDYLHSLLVTLWREKEGFSGKRPFGNSSWEYELYAPLIKAGFINGVIDDDGDITHLDEMDADDFVSALIDEVFYGEDE